MPVKEKRNNCFRNYRETDMRSQHIETEARAPGRPRSEQARQDILEAAYKLLKNKGLQSVRSHEIAKAAGVSSATLYRWWNSKEEIMFDACFEHLKPALAVSEKGTALVRLRTYMLRATDFMTSKDGEVMARLFTGIQEDKNLRRMFLERYVIPRRRIQGRIIKDAIAAGELKEDTDSDLLIDALNGPLFFRWLQGHAPLNESFAENIFTSVIPTFRPE
jgi:AcrR family transcriptional regulator